MAPPHRLQVRPSLLAAGHTPEVWRKPALGSKRYGAAMHPEEWPYQAADPIPIPNRCHHGYRSHHDHNRGQPMSEDKPELPQQIPSKASSAGFHLTFSFSAQCPSSERCVQSPEGLYNRRPKPRKGSASNNRGVYRAVFLGLFCGFLFLGSQHGLLFCFLVGFLDFTHDLTPEKCPPMRGIYEVYANTRRVPDSSANEDSTYEGCSAISGSRRLPAEPHRLTCIPRISDFCSR
jgi:hypothetical protein